MRSRELSSIAPIRTVRYLVVLCVFCGLAAACADTKKPTTRPAGIRERQDQALRDPFEYGPADDMPSVSGGGTADLDKKGIKRDWDNFWNP